MFLSANTDVRVGQVPSTKSLRDTSIGFWIIADKKLCSKKEDVILKA